MRVRRCVAALIVLLSGGLVLGEPAQATTPTAVNTNWFVSDMEVSTYTTIPAVFRPPMASLTSYCTVSGCWVVNPNRVVATFAGGGWYGYYDSVNRVSHTLGRMNLHYTVRLVGYRTDVYPFYSTSSRATRNTTLTGQMLYLSTAYPNGHGLPDLLHSPCGGRVAQASCYYYGTYRAYEARVSKTVFTGQALWRDNQHAGTWHFWAKSPIAQHTSLGWRFYYGIKTVPLRTGAGWVYP